MAVVDPPNRRILELVARVEDDIRSRGLKPGDRYLTTLEVASLLGVSTRFANDAMRLLATRQVLTRKPKAGTLIGPSAPLDEDAESRPFDVIHLLIRQDYYFSERRRMEALITGISKAMPGCSIQLNFVPAFNEQAYVERLLDAPATPRNAYLIAVKSPQLQKRFERHRSPVVLLGTPFEGISDIAWVDKDQASIGRLLMRRLIDLGHQRIGVVLRDRRGYGDDLMMDAITHELLDAGLGQGALIARSVPTEPALIALAITNLLSAQARPTALMCRNRLIAATAAQVCAQMKLQVGRDLVIALCDAAADADDVPPSPCIRPIAEMDAISEGTLLAQMLTEQAAVGGTINRRHRLIGVSL